VYVTGMEELRAIAVTPRHQIRLAAEYLPLIDKPPGRDFVVHVIEQRQANGLPLMAAEIVIAGSQTRAQFPLAAQFPLHFRKTYHAARLHGDTQFEYEYALRAANLMGLPPPIGASHNIVRHCFIPGRPYKRLSPFDPDGEDQNLRRARDLHLATAAGLWRLLEDAYSMLLQLHDAGITHGDTQLQNFIVSPAPLEVIMIDFEASESREGTDEALWTKRCAADFAPLLHEALLLQVTPGRQSGPLADHACSRALELFRDAKRVMRYIEQLEEIA
jgi:hypothetical protein